MIVSEPGPGNVVPQRELLFLGRDSPPRLSDPVVSQFVPASARAARCRR